MNITLAVLAATAVLSVAVPAARPAGFAVGTAATVIVLAPLRRDPAGAAAVPTSPWPGAAGAPGALVSLTPGVRLRMPVALPARRRPQPTSSRLPRGGVRAIALVLIALGVAIAVLQPQLRYGCLNLLPAFDDSDTCGWNTDLGRDGIAALSALVLSIAYAANRLTRAR